MIVTTFAYRYANIAERRVHKEDVRPGVVGKLLRG